jgi:hypothetical protein
MEDALGLIGRVPSSPPRSKRHWIADLADHRPVKISYLLSPADMGAE